MLCHFQPQVPNAVPFHHPPPLNKNSRYLYLSMSLMQHSSQLGWVLIEMIRLTQKRQAPTNFLPVYRNCPHVYWAEISPYTWRAACLVTKPASLTPPSVCPTRHCILLEGNQHQLLTKAGTCQQCCWNFFPMPMWARSRRRVTDRLPVANALWSAIGSTAG